MATPMLVTLEQVKADLRMDHNLDDADITLKILASSAAVFNYLKVPHDYYSDSTGAIPVLDSSGTLDVPFEVQAAVILMTRELCLDAKERTVWDPNYLPRPVVALLYPLRDPGLA